MRQRITTRGFRGESGNRRISIASRGYHPLGDVLNNICMIPVYRIQIQTYVNEWERPYIDVWREQINFNMYISKGFCYNIRR